MWKDRSTLSNEMLLDDLKLLHTKNSLSALFRSELGTRAIEDNNLKFLSGTLVDVIINVENRERTFRARWP